MWHLLVTYCDRSHVYQVCMYTVVNCEALRSVLPIQVQNISGISGAIYCQNGATTAVAVGMDHRTDGRANST
jgi:hypothetical protein